ncbi:MAG: DoxX family protein [Candidatus Rokubacteria bacterium]|nr:DoxX family protein [Candidatus Rokubacteria bacterium]
MKDYGPTVLRIFVGVIFVLHSYLALFVFTPAGYAGFIEKVAKLPIPVVIAWFNIIVHGIGGIMMILGVLTRWAAAGNALIMIGALLTVKLPQGFFLKGVIVDAAAGRAVAAGYEFELILLGALVALVLTGGGALAATRDR